MKVSDEQSFPSQQMLGWVMVEVRWPEELSLAVSLHLACAVFTYWLLSFAPKHCCPATCRQYFGAPLCSHPFEMARGAWAGCPLGLGPWGLLGAIWSGWGTSHPRTECGEEWGSWWRAVASWVCRECGSWCGTWCSERFGVTAWDLGMATTVCTAHFPTLLIPWQSGWRADMDGQMVCPGNSSAWTVLQRFRRYPLTMSVGGCHWGQMGGRHTLRGWSWTCWQCSMYSKWPLQSPSHSTTSSCSIWGSLTSTSMGRHPHHWLLGACVWPHVPEMKPNRVSPGGHGDLWAFFVWGGRINFLLCFCLCSVGLRAVSLKRWETWAWPDIARACPSPHLFSHVSRVRSPWLLLCGWLSSSWPSLPCSCTLWYLGDENSCWGCWCIHNNTYCLAMGTFAQSPASAVFS